MFKRSPAIEEKALRYLEERKVKATDIIKVLREQFEMPSGQAYDVARRSRQGATGKHFLQWRLAMTVVERGIGNGTAYFVVESLHAVETAGPFRTSSEAWRWIDRNEGQPVSKAEDRGDFAWNSSVDRRFS